MRAARFRMRRAGSSLVEIVVAVTILGIAAVGLAGMAFHAGQGASTTEATASRESVLANLSELAIATPFDDLTRLAGCEHPGEASFAYVYCIRVANENANLRAVTILVTPDNESVAADSAVLLRARGTASTPF